ncbi:plasmid segregation centromere-binding protein ParG [Nitrosospira multiformis]|uniref:Plasmid segregation centromere-binding protein ParG n=1 Tax=Nitrosospira multiformis TaxID=1231 RepID=A0A1H8IX30_9PROT|nr:hypothetical protein [Nitrosospira multiformis]SEN73031.1 plasmid segregation centromere-binding protein ParG [Nitrosospira multiformis]
MAIGKRPKIVDDDAAFQKFVERAPGAAPKEPDRPKEVNQPEQPKKKPRKGKQPITITIAPELLRKVDSAADAQGMSRAAYIAMALSYAVHHGIFK